MLTTVVVPEHFKRAGIQDIERELIGLVLAAPISGSQIVAPNARRALDDNPNSVLVQITGVRTHGYHPPSRPGWTPLVQARFGNRKSDMLDVRWVPHILGKGENDASHKSGNGPINNSPGTNAGRRAGKRHSV